MTAATLRAKPSEVSEISSPRSDFTAAAVREEMRRHVADMAALAATTSRKEALRFAANLLHLPYGRVRSLFYGEARSVQAHEADQIRAYVQAAIDLIQARADYEKQRADFLAAHPRLARLVPGPLPPNPIETAEDINK
jgi:hypothetical protein